AAAFAVATLVVTVLVVRLLTRVGRSPAIPSEPPSARLPYVTPVGFVVALLAGMAVGRSGGEGPGPLTEYALYALLAIVGFDLRVDAARIRSAWIPIAAAVVG